MNIKKCKLVLPIALSVLMGSQAVAAKNMELPLHVKDGCEMLAADLLRDQNYDSNCAFYTNGAGRYLKNAATMIEQEQYPQAILDMLRAEERLRAAELQKEKCANFSNISESYINQVVVRKEELIRFNAGLYN